MRFIHAITIATLAGSAASAQPVAKQLVEDADREVVQFASSIFPSSLSTIGSLLSLGDMNGDGVEEVLVTSPYLWESGSGSRYRSQIIDPTSHQVTLSLSRGTNPLSLAPTAGLRYQDLTGDGIDDLILGVSIANRCAVWVYSGADGARQPGAFFDETGIHGWGLSIVPLSTPQESDTRLLLGRTANPGAPSLDWNFYVWDPLLGTGFGTGSTAGSNEYISSGFALLDLGKSLPGVRTFHASRHATGTGFSGTPYSASGRLDLTNGILEDLLACGNFSPCDYGTTFAGAALLGDVNGDGTPEIVTTGAAPSGSRFYGVPVVDGVTGLVIGTHTPQAVFGDAALDMSESRPEAGTVALGDVTGDGFADYAAIAALAASGDPGEQAVDAVYVQCGRTGQTVAAFVGSLEGETRLTNSIQAGPFPTRRDAVVSPGDLNGDGVPDLLLLVRTLGVDAQAQLPQQLLLTHYLPTPCAGDVDFDRVVNFADLNAVLTSFGAQDITLPADLNADGVVNFADLNLVLSAFGVSCD